MSHKIDEKKENIQKIKKDIENTQHNKGTTNNIINSISDKNLINNYQEKNMNRSEAINLMINDVNNKVED